MIASDILNIIFFLRLLSLLMLPMFFDTWCADTPELEGFFHYMHKHVEPIVRLTKHLLVFDVVVSPSELEL